MKHCCSEMRFFIEENKLNIGYDARFREYYIFFKPKCGASKQTVSYCPWCGQKLPESLRDEWFDIMRNEYKLDDPCDDKRRIPREFRSDKWWKKRGL